MSKQKQLKISKQESERTSEPSDMERLLKLNREMPMANLVYRKMRENAEFRQAVATLPSFDIGEVVERGAEAGFAKVKRWIHVHDAHAEFHLLRMLADKSAFTEDYDLRLLSLFEKVKDLSEELNDLLPYVLIGQKIELWRTLYAERQTASDELALAISHYAEHHGTDEMRELATRSTHGDATQLVYCVVAELYKTHRQKI